MFHLDCVFIKAQRKEFQCHESVLVIFTLKRDLDSRKQNETIKNKIKCANIYMVLEFLILKLQNFDQEVLPKSHVQTMQRTEERLLVLALQYDPKICKGFLGRT